MPFDFFRSSLLLPSDVWEWLETEARDSACTSSEIATEALRDAKAAKETAE